MGGDLRSTWGGYFFAYFNPLRPCGRRPGSRTFRTTSEPLFQSTPPVWAETSCHRFPWPQSCHFNPLRPCGRRLCLSYDLRTVRKFQSTPPVWAETPRPKRNRRLPENFNPLRPCGRRPCFTAICLSFLTFQSTPPVWAETLKMVVFRHRA